MIPDLFCKVTRIAGETWDSQPVLTPGWYPRELAVPARLDQDASRRRFFEPDVINRIVIRSARSEARRRIRPEDQFEPGVLRTTYCRKTWPDKCLDPDARRALKRMTYADFVARYMNVWDEYVIPNAVCKVAVESRSVPGQLKQLRFYQFVTAEVSPVMAKSPKPDYPFQLLFPKGAKVPMYQVYVLSVKNRADRDRYAAMLDRQ